MNPVDSSSLRKACGRFATGITIVTTRVTGQVHGMTANAFMSVSLDPPLVLISVDNRAKMNQLLSQSGRYAVSILDGKQQELSDHFAGRQVPDLQVPFVDYHDQSVIEGALAWIISDVYQQIPTGDHTLHVGRVTHLAYMDGTPLLYYGGRYLAVRAEGNSI